MKKVLLLQMVYFTTKPVGEEENGKSEPGSQHEPDVEEEWREVDSYSGDSKHPEWKEVDSYSGEGTEPSDETS